MIPNRPIHPGRGVYVVFTGRGDEVGIVVMPVCDDGGVVEMVCEGTVVPAGCVVGEVVTTDVSLMKVTDAVLVIMPVRSLLWLYDSPMELRSWSRLKVYVPRGYSVSPVLPRAV